MGEYQFTTYQQTYERIENIGRGLLSIDARKGDRVLIFSETRAEWLLTALAAFRHGLTVVTLYSTLGEEAIKHGIQESEVSIVITSQELLSKLEVNQFIFLNEYSIQFLIINLENTGSSTEGPSCRLFSSIGKTKFSKSA